MKKKSPHSFPIKKGLLTILLTLAFFGKVNAAYFWQVQSIISFTGSATYLQSASANPLVLSIQQCAGGINQPHNSTTYIQTLYVNTLNSTVGGTVVSNNVINTPFIFAPNYSYTPSTSTIGTLYYYYLLTSPSMTTCGFTGTLTSAIATVVVSAPAKALNFDGVNDYVDLGSAITTSLSGSTKLTVEAWVKPSSLSNLGCILSNYNTTTINNLQVLLRRSGASFYEFWVGNGGTWNNVNSVAIPTLNVWQHVAGVWDGTIAKIYVNGVLSGTVVTTIPSLGNANTNNIWIGANNVNENFNGDIDEVRIWNRALCLGEIQNNMNGEIPTSSANLVANYHFNQGLAGQPNPSETSLIDASGNAYTGTLTNMALTGSVSNWIDPGAVSGTAPAFSNPTITVNSGNVCSGNSFTMSPSGATSYTYQGGSSIVSPTANTSYTVVGSTLGCMSNIVNSSVTVNSNPTITVNSGTVCSGNSFTIVPNGASTYTIQGGNNVVTPLSASSYTIKGTSSAGCLSANTATSNVAVNANPTVTAVSSTPNFICTGQTVSLTANGASSYVWNTTATTAVIAVQPTTTTSYTVNGTGTNGCSGSAVITQSVSACTGIENVSANSLDFQIYPNPSNGVLHIENQSFDSEPFTVELLNVLGQVIFRDKSLNNTLSLNISNLNNGYYIVKIHSNNKTIIKTALLNQ